jgi:hypothetical protein
VPVSGSTSASHFQHTVKHLLTFVDQGPAQQSFVDQSFVHQPPVEQAFNNQSLVAQQTVEQPNQYQHHSEQVYYQPNPNMGYDADMEDMYEAGLLAAAIGLLLAS